MPAYDMYRTRSYSPPCFLFSPSSLTFHSFHCLRKRLDTSPCVPNFISLLAEQPNTRNIHCRSFGWNSSVPWLDEACFLVDSSGRGDGLSQSSSRTLLCIPVRDFPHQIIWSRKTHPTPRSHLLVAVLIKGHGRMKLCLLTACLHSHWQVRLYHCGIASWVLEPTFNIDWR